MVINSAGWNLVEPQSTASPISALGKSAAGPRKSPDCAPDIRRRRHRAAANGGSGRGRRGRRPLPRSSRAPRRDLNESKAASSASFFHSAPSAVRHWLRTCEAPGVLPGRKEGRKEGRCATVCHQRASPSVHLRHRREGERGAAESETEKSSFCGGGGGGDRKPRGIVSVGGRAGRKGCATAVSEGGGGRGGLALSMTQMP